jgi:hypothetical protein
MPIPRASRTQNSRLAAGTYVSIGPAKDAEARVDVLDIYSLERGLLLVAGDPVTDSVGSPPPL